MKGLDTNVGLRLLVEDDQAQSARARTAVHRKSVTEKCWVNHVVLCEVVSVLGSAYRYRRHHVGDAVHALLRSDELVIEDRDVVRSALYALSNQPRCFRRLPARHV